VVETHRDRLIPVDRLVAEEWGRMNAPDPLPLIDGLLAATAKVVGLTVATHNLVDFARAGADCVDPFVS
jgi:predicted nucleic acid-binding protein